MKLNKLLTATVLVLVLTAVTVTVVPAQAPEPPPWMTGDAEADFTTHGFDFVFYDPDAPEELLPKPPFLGLPKESDPFSGWDVLAIYFDYDSVDDRMYVGIDCNGVCGDADGDGNPGSYGGSQAGALDLPDLGFYEAVALAIDTNKDGTPDVAVGVSATTDISQFRTYHYDGTAPPPGFPFFFGGVLPNDTPLYYQPSGDTPDIEFSIGDFSYLPGFTPGQRCFEFGFDLFSGSFLDGGISEDQFSGEVSFGGCDLTVTKTCQACECIGATSITFQNVDDANVNLWFYEGTGASHEPTPFATFANVAPGGQVTLNASQYFASGYFPEYIYNHGEGCHWDWDIRLSCDDPLQPGTLSPDYGWGHKLMVVDVVWGYDCGGDTGSPSSSCEVEAGGEVMYEYTVTNNGQSLSDVSIYDDKLGPINGVFSLALGETRTFTEVVEISVTTTNVVTVTGYIGDQECIATASATVTVSECICIGATSITFQNVDDANVNLWFYEGTGASHEPTPFATFANVAPGGQVTLNASQYFASGYFPEYIYNHGEGCHWDWDIRLSCDDPLLPGTYGPGQYGHKLMVVDVVWEPCAPPQPQGDIIYASSASDGVAGGVCFKDEDILAYDTGTGTWSMYFDGSDVGVASIDGFALLDDGSILMSFNEAGSISGLGAVDDSDIVKFIPTSTGSTTAGSFEWYFDGSDVGLTLDGEDVDAIDFTPGGKLVISTIGDVSVPGVSGTTDEDLLVFTATSLGQWTTGTWAVYFDGSDVGLGYYDSEDVKGIWIDSASGDIYLTTLGVFDVGGGVSGDGADIFICTPGSLGWNTTCTYSNYWDGSDHGFGGEVLDGFTIAL